MRLKKAFASPFTYPIYFFVLAILAGAVLLHHPMSQSGGKLSWVDAVFTATSATCVTGLAVVDTGSHFSQFGQGVILALIQLGGLGIMTYASLVFYLWRRRVSLTDRLAVGQSLLHDPSFHLGRFLMKLALWTALIETAGAFFLYLLDPRGFAPFSAFFHSISAFCNAGFSLYPDSLSGWRGNWGINLVIMVLIIWGGIGFSVIMELESFARKKFSRRPRSRNSKLSWYAKVVVRTSLFLVLVGWGLIYLAEFVGFHRELPWSERLLGALFQSVTCRTAGFNTLDISHLTNVSLLLMLVLMFVGGSPGSCAGGIKTTSFRVLVAFASAQMRGHRQAVVNGYAVDDNTLNKVLTLVTFAFLIVFAAVIILTFTEGGDVPHPETRGQFLEIVFEVVSAFGTVGLSTGLTPKLTVAGKAVVTMLMFIGRLGPILFLTVMQGMHEKPHYRWPEESMLVG